MSIRRNAYSLCKSVSASPIRNNAKELVNNRNSREEPFFGYVSEQYRAQLLGYLITDRDKEEISKSFLPIKRAQGLSKEEKNLFLQIHKQFVLLNKMCVSPIIESSPELGLVIDPYNTFEFDIPENIGNIELYDEEKAKVLINSFHSHPAFVIASESYATLKKMWSDIEKPSPELLQQSVNSIEKILLDAGPLNSNRELSNLSLAASQPGSIDNLSLNFMFALVSLRASLETLNELLYQALLTDQLPVLDDNNIIKIMKVMETLSGMGYLLKCQPNMKAKLGRFGLILIKAKIYDRYLDLCRVEAMNIADKEGFGEIVDFSLRNIDENLNPYQGLIEDIE